MAETACKYCGGPTTQDALWVACDRCMRSWRKEKVPFLLGTWRHAHGEIFCGTLRIARADFDTDPNIEFRTRVFDEICATLNQFNNVGAEMKCENPFEPGRKGVLCWRTKLTGNTGRSQPMDWITAQNLAIARSVDDPECVYWVE